MMMYWRLLLVHVSVILVVLTPINTTGIPEIASYAKVSRSCVKSSNSPITSSGGVVSEGRSYQASPVYVPSKSQKLRNGEAQDFAPSQQYSTLDEDMLSNLDARKLKKQAQDRFHPPAPFEHSVAHSNKVKYQQADGPPDASEFSDSPGAAAAVSSGGYTTLPKDVYSDSYEYPLTSKPKDTLPSITIDDYSPNNYNPKPVDSYPPSQTSYSAQQVPSYLERYPDKPDYPGPDSSFDDASYSHDHDHYPHDIIYDHPPHDYHHDFTTTTTEEPEMNDQRLNKRPYSYYYIGKKLWYLPLYFSIYFIIYIAALVLKSIARHKINFPQQLAEAAGANGRHMGQDGPGWWDLTQRVLNGIDAFASGIHEKNRGTIER
ncbi:uncharacterized protein LOC107037000 [Diachasma alloeum]|uniref:uncharacterized protein LOC107037000 n=1 Tax=Diachasma alloeum TaxID=454923 RepID=UPI0007383969|nr:uncharacterized protein LOC107037000 [Diachasma alloeum]